MEEVDIVSSEARGEEGKEREKVEERGEEKEMSFEKKRGRVDSRASRGRSGSIEGACSAGLARPGGVGVIPWEGMAVGVSVSRREAANTCCAY